MKQPINEIKKMQRIAGLITESEYQEAQLSEEQYAEPMIMIQNIIDNYFDGGIDADAAMTRIEKILQGNYEDESGDDDSNKLEFSSDVKAYIDDAVKSAKEDGEFEELKKVGFFDTELIDNILEEFDEEGEYDGVNQAVKDYIAKVTGSMNEGHYWDTEINKDLKTGQKIQFGGGEKTAHNILDLNKNPELKQQVQVGDLVYNTLGKRWVVSKIEGDKISLRTLDSVEYGAMDLTV